MTSETRTITIQCLCKINSLPINVDLGNFPGPAGYCHCNSCRHLTGTLCNSDIFCSKYASFPFKSVATLGRYRFSPRFDIYFCNICGTTLIWFEASTGRLSAASSPIVEEDIDATRGDEWHMFIEDTKDGGLSTWMPKHDDGRELAKYTTTKDDGKVWTSLDHQLTASHQHASDLLPGHCVCKGVKFWIARPTEQSVSFDATHSNIFRDHSNPPKKWWLDERRRRFTAANCACTSCRLASGCEVMQWAFVPEHNIKLDAAGKEPLRLPFGSLQAYKSSADVTRYFCRNCGAVVFWASEARKSLIDVGVGLLNAAEGARAESWLSWTPLKVSHPEDSEGRSSMVRALSKGIKASHQELLS